MEISRSAQVDRYSVCSYPLREGKTVISGRYPVHCLSCSGILNEYCSIDSNSNWNCSLCFANNPPFCSSQFRNSADFYSNYLELTNSELQYVTIQSDDHSISKPVRTDLLLLCIDISFPLEILHKMLDCFCSTDRSDDTIKSVMICSIHENSVHIYRLGEFFQTKGNQIAKDSFDKLYNVGDYEVIGVDVIPDEAKITSAGITNNAVVLFKKLIDRGVYDISISILSQNVSMIARSLAVYAGCVSSCTRSSLASICGLIEVIASQSASTQLQLCLFLHECLPVDCTYKRLDLKSTMAEEVVVRYAEIGELLARCNCLADVFFCNKMPEYELKALNVFVSATSGIVFKYDEDDCSDSFIHDFQDYLKEFCSKTKSLCTNASIKLLCSANLQPIRCANGFEHLKSRLIRSFDIKDKIFSYFSGGKSKMPLDWERGARLRDEKYIESILMNNEKEMESDFLCGGYSLLNSNQSNVIDAGGGFRFPLQSFYASLVNSTQYMNQNSDVFSLIDRKYDDSVSGLTKLISVRNAIREATTSNRCNFFSVTGSIARVYNESLISCLLKKSHDFVDNQNCRGVVQVLITYRCPITNNIIYNVVTGCIQFDDCLEQTVLSQQNRNFALLFCRQICDSLTKELLQPIKCYSTVSNQIDWRQCVDDCTSDLVVQSIDEGDCVSLFSESPIQKILRYLRYYYRSVVDAILESTLNSLSTEKSVSFSPLEFFRNFARFSRFLYHFRSGPLLVPPSIHSDDSFRLTYIFINKVFIDISNSHSLSSHKMTSCLAMVQPLCLLHPGNLLGGSELEKVLVGKPPDSVYLTLNCVGVIHLGFSVITWEGAKSNQSIQSLKDFAIKLSNGAFSPLIAVKQSSPKARIVYSRISPLHKENTSSLKLLIPNFGELWEINDERALKEMYFTDDPSFLRYLKYVMKDKFSMYAQRNVDGVSYISVAVQEMYMNHE